MTDTTIVVPTLGRASLGVLLHALRDGTERPHRPVVVVDDRPDPGPDLPVVADLPVVVLRSGGRGPAAARNLGWRHASTTWVSFLDDDVEPPAGWYAALLADLAEVSPGVAGSQGGLRVPLPTTRRPTDWERSTGGLADAPWITADMTYRRSVLAEVGGFDERFPRAFREDADLALRVLATGRELARGRRFVTHPVRAVDDWVSVRQQAGNADDMLMAQLHGPAWRRRAGTPKGRRRRHVAVTAAGALAVALAVTGRWRPAALALAAWGAGTAELAAARIAPGPRDWPEVRRMLLTSAVIPAAATWHSARGAWQHRRAEPWRGAPDVVLFDRDGTLVHDVPYNGRPELVRPVDGAADALDRLRGAGVRIGLVTNQSGVGSGRITHDDVLAVNRRVEAELGPFDTVQWCPHRPDEGCSCRKPAPGMVVRACAELGADPARCVLVGDIGADVRAAEAAGGVGILVPTAATRAAEVDTAERVHPDLDSAVTAILGGRW
ncbi:MAG TPA: HAD-IIIA family hydrolase [Lapillicoccus sp.]|nr:HAD-IIIA family hydrolase [Lapillicoccus sp.]